MEVINKVDNMKDFAELFMIIYSFDLNSHNIIGFSTDIDTILELVLNKPKYKAKLNKNLYDENGIFKIDEFIKEINNSNVKKYCNFNYMYNPLSSYVFTEVDKNKSLKLSEKYSYSDIILVSQIVSDIIINNNYYISYNNLVNRSDEMAAFVKALLTEYSFQIMNDSGRIELSRHFKEIIEYIMNEPEISVILNNSSNNLYDEDSRFKIDEFLQELDFCSVKSYWAEEWQYDLESKTFSTNINKEVRNLISTNMDERLKNIIHIILDKINEYEDTILKYEQNQKKLNYKAMTEIGTSNSD